jgi:signal transduction histidine kinase
VRGAIENLLRNAGESAPQGEITLTLTSDREALIIEVRDEGPGIPRDELERIFAPFHTTRTQGTGLGLAVARRIAEAHGGSLTARNVDPGACFTMRLGDAVTSDQRG